MITQKTQKMLFVTWMEDRLTVRKLLLLLSLFLGINLDAEVLQGDDQGHHQEGDQDHHHAGLHQDADLEDAPDLLLVEDHHPLGVVRHQGDGLHLQDVEAGQDQGADQDLLQQEGEEDLLLAEDPGAQLAAAEIPPHQALTVPVKKLRIFFILILIY